MSTNTTVGNRLLAGLPEAESRLLDNCLEPVRLKAGEDLYGQGDPVKHVYFPLDCVVSTLAIMSDGATVEVALVGSEGVVGVVAVFGEYTARNWTRVLIGGDALKASAREVRRLSERSEAVRRRMMDYYRSVITHVSQRAVCNGRHTIMQRLCCWLLLVYDRAGRDDLQLTQEEMASKLGSRRAGVTRAARALLDRDVITYSRGRVHIRDRELLEAMACECYRVHRDEFFGTSDAGARRAPSRLGEF